MKPDGLYSSVASFNEAFFIRAAECGVRSIELDCLLYLLNALVFGFTAPTTGVHRSILIVEVQGPYEFDQWYDGENFLAELVKVGSSLNWAFKGVRCW